MHGPAYVTVAPIYRNAPEQYQYCWCDKCQEEWGWCKDTSENYTKLANMARIHNRKYHGGE